MSTGWAVRSVTLAAIASTAVKAQFGCTIPNHAQLCQENAEYWLTDGHCSQIFAGQACCDCRTLLPGVCRGVQCDISAASAAITENCNAAGGTPSTVGNGVCDPENNNEECLYDQGDCCECDCFFNPELCGSQGFSCVDPSSTCVGEPTPTDAPVAVQTSSPVNEGTVEPTPLPFAAPAADFSFSYSYTYEPWYDDDYYHDSPTEPVTSPVSAPYSEAPTSSMPVTAPVTLGTAPVSPSPVAPTRPAPIASSPVAQAPTAEAKCSNGVRGVESDNGKVCCVAECGSCGGVGCSKFSPDLGADDCCVTEILDDGEACSVWGEAPCFIDGDSPVPSPTEEASTMPTASMPTGSGTAPTTPGTAPVAPIYTGPTSPTGSKACSNGIYGVESDNGKVCCDAECGACGGVGCSRFSTDLGADGCCVTEILLGGEACSVTGVAPCFYDDWTIPGPAPTMTTTPAQEDEFSFSYYYSYTYEPWYDDDDDDDVKDPTPAPSTTAPVTAPTPVTAGMPVSLTESFTVDVPNLDQTSVDFGLLVDVSGSYNDDIANLKLLAAELVQSLADDTADLALGLGSFSDTEERTGIPGSEYTLVKPFGSCDTEDCFEQDQEDFIAAVDTLDANQSGRDFSAPESQTIALVRAAEDWAWRAGVLKVLAITTDAPFHVPEDGDEYFSLDEVIAACNTENIKILALKAPGAQDEMDTIAEGTGGVVETTAADSEDIVGAILQGLAGVQYSRVEVDWVCEDGSWTLTVDPSSGYDDVVGGTSLDFTVTVTVPAGATAGTSCAANVLADGVLVGEQEFTYLADGTVTATLFLP